MDNFVKFKEAPICIVFACKANKTYQTVKYKFKKIITKVLIKNGRTSFSDKQKEIIQAIFFVLSEENGGDRYEKY